VVLPVLARVNPGDITVRHPWTGDPLRVHSFRHRGFWFNAGDRERQIVLDFIRLIGRRDTIYDVGGHIGFTSMLFSALAVDGAVHVFEPSPDNLRYLRRNVAHNPNVTVIAAAVGAEPGRASLHLEDLSGQNNSLVPDGRVLDRTARSVHVQPHVDVTEVEVVTLDGHAARHQTKPDFVKVDVEGFEWEVLQGALETVRDHCPIWMVELTRRRDETLAWMEGRGYAPLDERLRRLDRPPWPGQNVVFMHRERHAWALERFTS
jgi:FkbM family methyltransferase